MRVILQVVSGPAEGRRFPLQDGELARFGRSDNADVSLPADDEMSDIHFELECQAGRCVIRDLPSSGGTLLNDQPVTEADFHSGDVITAGQTNMLVWIAGENVIRDPDETPAEAPSNYDVVAEPTTAAALCAHLDLEDESLALLQAEHTPEAFIDVLIEHQRFADALRVLSFSLTRRQAVWWAYQCVTEAASPELSPKEQAALEAALNWVKEPTEEHRRAAMTASELAELQSAPGWVAMAAFWSDGSLAPPDLPEVPPGEHLANQGATAALLLLATHGDTAKADERYRRILKTGQDVLSSSLPIPA